MSIEWNQSFTGYSSPSLALILLYFLSAQSQFTRYHVHIAFQLFWSCLTILKIIGITTSCPKQFFYVGELQCKPCHEICRSLSKLYHFRGAPTSLIFKWLRNGIISLVSWLFLRNSVIIHKLRTTKRTSTIQLLLGTPATCTYKSSSPTFLFIRNILGLK